MTTLYSLMYKKNINDAVEEKVCSLNHGAVAGASEALKADVGGKCEQGLEQSCIVGCVVFFRPTHTRRKTLTLIIRGCAFPPLIRGEN